MLTVEVRGTRAIRFASAHGVKALRKALFAAIATMCLTMGAPPKEAAADNFFQMRWWVVPAKQAAKNAHKKKLASIPGTAAYICSPSGFGRKSTCYRRT